MNCYTSRFGGLLLGLGFVLLTDLFLGVSDAASAQTVVVAAETAAAVRSFYEQKRTIQVRFAQHFWSRVYRRTQSSRGRLVIQRPGRIRFDYEHPTRRVVVSDGTNWIMYEPIEGTAGQYARGSVAAANAAAFSFLTGELDFASHRLSIRAPSRTDPADTLALQLTPRRPNASYVRIVLYVDARPPSSGAVQRVSVEDPDGNWNRFDFSDFVFDTDLDSALFQFTPPAGAREIEAPSGR